MMNRSSHKMELRSAAGNVYPEPKRFLRNVTPRRATFQHWIEDVPGHKAVTGVFTTSVFYSPCLSFPRFRPTFGMRDRPQRESSQKSDALACFLPFSLLSQPLSSFSFNFSRLDDYVSPFRSNATLRSRLRFSVNRIKSLDVEPDSSHCHNLPSTLREYRVSVKCEIPISTC